MDAIQKTLENIKELTGLSLTLCDYFTGLRTSGDKKYFNVILPTRTSEAVEYTRLLQISKGYGTIAVEPNGVNRLAIFILNYEKLEART